MHTIRHRMDDEQGAVMVEYGMVVTFIVLVALVVARLLSFDVLAMFQSIAGSMP